METHIHINDLVIFMLMNGLNGHSVYRATMKGWAEGQITEWEFVCNCQYVVDAATIAKLEAKRGHQSLH